MDKHIEVWDDEEGSAICVSLCEADGDEIKCLRSFDYDDEESKIDALDEAKEYASLAAAKRDCTRFFRSLHGQLERI